MHTSSSAKSASGGHLIRASQRAAAPPSRRVPAGGWDTIIITARGRRACSSGVGVMGHWQRTPAWAMEHALPRREWAIEKQEVGVCVG